MTDTPLPVVTPIIHPNGDRRETLLDNLEALYTALRAADKALAQCAPNGRNFYPAPGRMERAQQLHRDRQVHLKIVMESVVAEAEQMQYEGETDALKGHP